MERSFEKRPRMRFSKDNGGSAGVGVGGGMMHRERAERYRRSTATLRSLSRRDDHRSDSTLVLAIRTKPLSIQSCEPRLIWATLARQGSPHLRFKTAPIC